MVITKELEELICEFIEQNNHVNEKTINLIKELVETFPELKNKINLEVFDD